jgi:hypothetical protein
VLLRNTFVQVLARHTPQFLQRSTTPQRAGAGVAFDDDDDFED